MQAIVHASVAALQAPALAGETAAQVRERQRAHAALVPQGDAVTSACLQALWQQIDEQLHGAGTAQAAPAEAGGGLMLTLMDDDDIEEDIEAMRVLHEVEASAGREMKELQALCTTVRGLRQIGPQSHPLRPEVCMHAVAQAGRRLGLARAPRLAWLRVVGDDFVRKLKGLYADHARYLRHQGVEPMPFPQGVATAPAAAAAPGAPDAVQSLVARARAAQARDLLQSRAVPPEPLTVPVQAPVPAAPAASPPGTPTHRQAAADEEAPAIPLQLFDEPQGLQAPVPEAMDPGQAATLMQRLITHFAEQAAPAPRIHRLLMRLIVPARLSAAQDPDVWRSREHPVWQLMDRMATLGALYARPDGDVPADHPILGLLDQLVTRLEQAPQAGPQAYAQAIERIDRHGDTLIDQEVAQAGAQIEASDAAAQRLDLEPLVRRQLTRQIQDAPRVPAAVRAFLLGPWVTVLSLMMARDGEADPTAQRYVDLVDQLLALGNPAARAAGIPAPLPLPRLLAVGREGLAAADTPPAQISMQLAELTRVLRDPAAAMAAESALDDAASAPALDAPSEPAAFSGTETGGALPTLPGTEFAQHGVLPTVPIDILPSDGPTRASRDRESWLQSLRPGQVCRLFIGARWATLRVLWRSDNHQVLMFSGRHGRQQSITRRALERLRAAGLAATVPQGSLIDRAMATLPMELD